MKKTKATVLIGDAVTRLHDLESNSVQCIVTSPPYYGLRDYGVDGQLGLESTPDEYVSKLVSVFREARRVLRDDGALWLNLGDSYAANRTYQVQSTKGGTKHGTAQAAQGRGSVVPDGLKSKDLIGIPWRVAFALQADGWYLRQDIIWHKLNPMPESVKDRCTKSHEYLFLLTKSPKYYFDVESIKEPAVKKPMKMQASQEAVSAKSNGPMARGAEGFNHQFADPDRLWAADGLRNKRDVWSMAARPFRGAHFATFPPDLVEPCVKAGCPKGGIVLDIFNGSGTTGMVALKFGRSYIGIELNRATIEDIALDRLKSDKYIDGTYVIKRWKKSKKYKKAYVAFAKKQLVNNSSTKRKQKHPKSA